MPGNGFQRHHVLVDEQIDRSTQQARTLRCSIAIPRFRLGAPSRRPTLEQRLSAFIVQKFQGPQSHQDRANGYTPATLQQQQVVQGHRHTYIGGEGLRGQEKRACEPVGLLFKFFVTLAIGGTRDVPVKDQMPELVGKVESASITVVLVGREKHQRSAENGAPRRQAFDLCDARLFTD